MRSLYIALALGLATPALADGPYDGPSRFNWSGLYVGAHAGKQIDGAITYEDQTPSDFDGPGHPVTDKLDGFIGGGHLGYNFQTGALVLGVEASIDGGDISAHRLEVPALDYITDTDVNYMASLSGRVGFALGRALIFGKAGVSYIDLDYAASFHVGKDQFARETSFSDVGYVIGGGIEYALTDHVILGAEYEHHEFDGETKDINRTNGCCGDTDTLKASNIDADIVKARLSYKF